MDFGALQGGDRVWSPASRSTFVFFGPETQDGFALKVACSDESPPIAA